MRKFKMAKKLYGKKAKWQKGYIAVICSGDFKWLNS